MEGDEGAVCSLTARLTRDDVVFLMTVVEVWKSDTARDDVAGRARCDSVWLKLDALRFVLTGPAEDEVPY